MEDYFRDKSFAKLIYLSNNQLPEAKRLAINFNWIENCETTQGLKNMTPDQVFFVTDELLLRGFDYRSDIGIHLLVAAKFSSVRHKD